MRLAVSVLFLLFTQPVAAQAAVPDAAALFAAGLWDVRDEPTSLAGLRGRALIVNFWARWCGPCRAEIPELVAAHRGLKGKDPLVVGIALDECGQTVREFAKVYEMDYLLLLVYLTNC